MLITGAAGFLGFYFTMFFCSLIEKGINIKLLLLDNFIIGKPKWLDDLEIFKNNVSIYDFDIAKNKIDSVDGCNDVDFVIHMASIASPTYYRKYPLQTIDANVWGLRSLLDYYKDMSIKGFLFFSSSEIYGSPPREFVPTSEEYEGNVSCVGPRACYDEAKRFGETLSYIYANIFNFPIRVVRPFNNYGPGMSINDKRVPADFAKSVVEGKDIVMLSDGTPKRTFCYIADAIVGYLKALVYTKYEYFNIGIDFPEISIKEFAQIYQDAGSQIFGYKGKVIYEHSQDKEYLVHNPLRRCPDIEKARKLLNFDPKINVKDGVKRFLQYLKEER
ncbi:MAG: NAD-dependent epimerase/dehydratase family protein [Parcubacteria group bacterium]|nr:NAD-dependent epimerase/dehydratase family protein [Parcubacteria group bacterium]